MDFPLTFFNSLSGEKERFQPMGSPVRLYVCGPTVYDAAHLGHARCYITWDVLVRVLRFAGYKVTYVRNVTDVDDKILARAKESGTTREALAETHYQSFKADMAALNVGEPTHEPRATQHIREMQTGIRTLLNNGSAYTTADGSVYFRVASKADYGKLKFTTDDTASLAAHLNDLQAGARVEAEEGKESPLDFALWKTIPESDPEGWAFDEERLSSEDIPKQKPGRGRPGWHLECSAMNHAIFGGKSIDIHAGGADLIFPHHENEIAQSEAWMGHQPFARLWMHNGFVKVDGKKMSKSLGNFSTVGTLLARYEANAIRHFLLSKGYRMPVDFTDEALEASTHWVKNCVKLLRLAQDKLELSAGEAQALVLANAAALEQATLQQKDSQHFQDIATQLRAMADDLSDDLNTAKGLSRLYDSIGRLKAGSSSVTAKNATKPNDASPSQSVEELKTQFQIALSMWALLGFDLESVFSRPQLPLEPIQALLTTLTGEAPEAAENAENLLLKILAVRQEAKATKNWAVADAVRKSLEEIGLQALDEKDGSLRVEWEGTVVALLPRTPA
jgi:cysteinyl-tRNA synthetase